MNAGEGNSQSLKELLGLEAEPVAVFLPALHGGAPAFDGFDAAERHRYCQILMRARRGESVWLAPEELACPAAAKAFGFKPLPQSLACGQGLVGFGIATSAPTGKAMFNGMTGLPAGSLAGIAVCPLCDAPATPDVVVVEGSPERLMWLVLADLNVAGGARRLADTAVLQATCVDATLIPHVHQRLNFSLGCYGCREATDLGEGEAVLGFPGAALAGLITQLESLAKKAMGRSRAKVAYGHLSQRLGKAADQPADRAGPAVQIGALPQLDGDMVIKLTPDEVMRVYCATLDGDRDLALSLVTDVFHRKIKKVLERPHCLPVFEMSRKVGDQG